MKDVSRRRAATLAGVDGFERATARAEACARRCVGADTPSWTTPSTRTSRGRSRERCERSRGRARFERIDRVRARRRAVCVGETWDF